MRKTGLPAIAWVLAGLLGIAGALISLGQQDQSAVPEVKSYSPSGISAFVDLLRKDGVAVAVNRESKPRLSQNDVAVAFKIVNSPETTIMSQAGQKSKSELFQEQFWKFVRDGGTGILLPLDSDFLTDSLSTKKNPYTAVSDLATHENFKITTGGVLPDTSFDIPEEGAGAADVELWSEPSGTFLRAYRVGKGTALIARDAIGITNRFIDKYDNARAYSSLFSILDNSHKRIVFTEASFGSVEDPGLLEAIGPWANAAWQQLIFLGLVIVFTLGKRFGTPDETKLPQRGSRELLDAIADTFKRSRSTQAAMATALRTADIDIRLVLKLPRDATRSERDRLLPAGLQNALGRLQVACDYPHVSQDYALDLIVRAQKELDEFIGSNRAKIRSLAKLRS